LYALVMAHAGKVATKVNAAAIQEVKVSVDGRLDKWLETATTQGNTAGRTEERNESNQRHATDGASNDVVLREILALLMKVPPARRRRSKRKAPPG